MGKDQSEWHHLPKPTIEFYQWLKENRRRARNMSLNEVMAASKTTLSKDAIRGSLRRKGVLPESTPKEPPPAKPVKKSPAKKPASKASKPAKLTTKKKPPGKRK